MMNMPLNLTPPAINPNAEKVLSKRYYRKDENGQCVEDATGLFWRVASSVAAEEAKYEQSPWKPDALARALGGDDTSEYTDCSTTNLLDPVTKEWDWEVIDRVGLPREVFPKIVKPCTFGGTLSEELQRELGCGPIPIIKVGSHDTASAVGAAQMAQTFLPAAAKSVQT